MSTDNVVIVSGVRTPMGGFQGSLAAVSAPELGAISIAEAIRRAGLQPADVQEVIMGNVLPAGLKQGPARQAMRQAGLPDSTGATTINKLCGSGMKAAMFARKVLRFTYVHAFYMENEEEQRLFEYQQGELERAVEKLSYNLEYRAEEGININNAAVAAIKQAQHILDAGTNGAFDVIEKK